MERNPSFSNKENLIKDEGFFDKVSNVTETSRFRVEGKKHEDKVLSIGKNEVARAVRVPLKDKQGNSKSAMGVKGTSNDIINRYGRRKEQQKMRKVIEKKKKSSFLDPKKLIRYDFGVVSDKKYFTKVRAEPQKTRIALKRKLPSKLLLQSMLYDTHILHPPLINTGDSQIHCDPFKKKNINLKSEISCSYTSNPAYNIESYDNEIETVPDPVDPLPYTPPYVDALSSIDMGFFTNSPNANLVQSAQSVDDDYGEDLFDLNFSDPLYIENSNPVVPENLGMDINDLKKLVI